MNLKLNNEVRGSVSLLQTAPVSSIKAHTVAEQHMLILLTLVPWFLIECGFFWLLIFGGENYTNKMFTYVRMFRPEALYLTQHEERRRTGRYIAILVGISLLMLAIYHAWVRRIPVVASLVVPALIMFVYVGWVLYTASRDKHKLLHLRDAEAALAAANELAENDGRVSQLSNNNLEVSVISSKDGCTLNSPEGSVQRDWSRTSSTYLKEENKTKTEERKRGAFIKPIILINDKPPEDLDQKWTHIVENLANNEKLKGFSTRRRYKRKFCRRRRNATFKRSYTIG